MRHYSPLDKLIGYIDVGIRSVSTAPHGTGRPNPADVVEDAPLSDSERRLSGALMRVNHTGEVCAQALYEGQSLFAREQVTEAALHHAAIEERDHLRWCFERIDELGAHPSYLNPFWYATSFALGAGFAFFGDGISLGFLEETEHQVVLHIDEHLDRLPAQDAKSRAILGQMQADEAKHQQTAHDQGAATLPFPVPEVMQAVSLVMKRVAFYV